VQTLAFLRLVSASSSSTGSSASSSASSPAAPAASAPASPGPSSAAVPEGDVSGVGGGRDSVDDEEAEDGGSAVGVAGGLAEGEDEGGVSVEAGVEGEGEGEDEGIGEAVEGAGRRGKVKEGSTRGKRIRVGTGIPLYGTKKTHSRTRLPSLAVVFFGVACLNWH